MSVLTPSQTVGPFYAYGLTPKGRAHWDPDGTYAWKETVGSNLVTPDVVGDRIRIEGGIYDGDGKPIPDAMLEIWQADGNGKYSNEPGSRRSSIGLFVTRDTYVGRHGRSLRLDGLEPGVNDLARERRIVMHGADYVSDHAVSALGRLRSSLMSRPSR